MLESWVALEVYARQYQRETVAWSETQRLLRSAAASGDFAARVRWRLLMWLGRGLVSLGTRMQEADPRRVGTSGLRRAS